MIPLPVYQGDVCGALLGAMLFPNDAAKAESFAAQLLTKGPLQDFLRAGYSFSPEQQILLFSAFSQRKQVLDSAGRNLRGISSR